MEAWKDLEEKVETLQDICENAKHAIEQNQEAANICAKEVGIPSLLYPSWLSHRISSSRNSRHSSRKVIPSRVITAVHSPLEKRIDASRHAYDFMSE